MSLPNMRLLCRTAQILLLVFLLHLFYPKPIKAASWIYVNLNNYSIGVIKVAPSNNLIMYCNGARQNERALFKSINGGKNWIIINVTANGLPLNPDINSIAIHPVNSNIVYVGIYDKGIYKTVNGGISWSLSGLQNQFIRALTIDKINPLILYAGTGTNNINGGVYKSIDGGISWNLKTNGIGKPNILEITIDPSNPTIVYASGHRLWKSINEGNSWQILPFNGSVAENAFAINPSNNQILYAGQVNVNFGLYKSVNGGMSWKSSGLENKRIHEIIIDKESKNIFISTRGPNFPGSGIYLSNNEGESWQQINEGLLTLETAALQINYKIPKTLFLGTINTGLWNFNLSSPIILLPGFGGSWNLGAITTGVEIGPWKRVPFFWPYDNLRQTLTSPEVGYKEDEDYFEFYYDWRKKIDDLTDDFDEYLDTTVLVDKPPGTKVNLVGHSMGGLVARAYASKYGDEKIEKIISVGSPHKGALETYYAWEGGQAGDKMSWSSVVLQLLLEIRKKRFHTPKQAVHQFVPSIQDMLPIFDFLKNPDGSIKDVSSMVEQNEYLKNLVDTENLKQKLTTIYGKENNPENDTVEYYNIVNRTPLDKLLGFWVDGFPVSQEYTPEGDLSVLTKSAIVQEASSTPEVAGDHIEIVESSTGIQEILNSLGINEATPTVTSTSPPRNPSLVFFLHSPANLKVISPNGEVGHEIANPLEGAVYSPNDKLIVIPNAQQGDYQVELIGTGTGIYHLEIAQLTASQNQWQTIKGKITLDETVSLNLEFDPQSPKENPLKDETGEIFLILTKQQLEELNKYINVNISARSTKRRLQYYVKRIIKQINRSSNYINRGKYYPASRYTLSSLISCYRLRININQYLKRNTLSSGEAIYLKNQLELITNLLSSNWVNLYQKAGKSIRSLKISRYQKALQRILAGIKPRIQLKADLGENKDLGIAFSLAQEKHESGLKYSKSDPEEANLQKAYINFISSRLYLLETLKLLR